MKTKNETLRQKNRKFKTVTHHKIDEIKMFSVHVEKLKVM